MLRFECRMIDECDYGPGMVMRLDGGYPLGNKMRTWYSSGFDYISLDVWTEKCVYVVDSGTHEVSWWYECNDGSECNGGGVAGIRNIKWEQGVTFTTMEIYQCSISNGCATITSLKNSLAGAVTLPSAIDGVVVTAIASGAFGVDDAITAITIPATVTSIGSGAFPSRITSLSVASGNSAYYSMNNMVITRDTQEVVAMATKGNSNITIPSGVKSIGSYVGYDS